MSKTIHKKKVPAITRYFYFKLLQGYDIPSSRRSIWSHVYLAEHVDPKGLFNKDICRQFADNDRHRTLSDFDGDLSESDGFVSLYIWGQDLILN